MTVFQTIVAKSLILVEAILDTLVELPSYNANGAATCSPAVITSNGLTTCGDALVAQMGAFIVQGVGFLAGTLTALGVT